MTVEMKENQVTETGDGRVLEVHVTGKLSQSDYQQFMPKVEAMIKAYGKIRVLLYLHDFDGWSASTLWEDVKFDVKHFNDIQRLAIVGEAKWQQGMTTFCKPFTTAEIKYFEHSQLPEARQWVRAENGLQ